MRGVKHSCCHCPCSPGQGSWGSCVLSWGAANGKGSTLIQKVGPPSSPMSFREMTEVGRASHIVLTCGTPLPAAGESHLIVL